MVGTLERLALQKEQAMQRVMDCYLANQPIAWSDLMFLKADPEEILGEHLDPKRPPVVDRPMRLQ